MPTIREFIDAALFSTRDGITLNAALDKISAERGNAVGLWHVLVHNEQLVFAGEAQARAAVAAYLRAARESHRLESGTRRGARRLHPPAKLRDGASGRSYRGPAAGMHWETDTLSVRYVRLYRRTEQMEHGRRAEQERVRA